VADLDLLAVVANTGYPEPARHVRRREGRGRLNLLDARGDAWKVAVKIGGVHHLDVGRMFEDAQRWNALELEGHLVLATRAWPLASGVHGSPRRSVMPGVAAAGPVRT
jgi:hypothetical protein